MEDIFRAKKAIDTGAAEVSMTRMFSFCVMIAAVAASAVPAIAQRPSGDSPVLYELMINGESFTVEGNRLVKLQSKEKPGASYEVALRVAPTQRMKLGSVQFEYDWLCKVERTGGREQRSVRLTHERGFNMLVTDLGDTPLEAEARDEALKILVESATESLKEPAVTKLDVGKPQDKKFEGAGARGVVIRCHDGQDLGRTSLVYVLVGAKFTVSCIVQYLDNDAADVVPVIRRTLDSFRPARP
jgi:hypothetical protein